MPEIGKLEYNLDSITSLDEFKQSEDEWYYCGGGYIRQSEVLGERLRDLDLLDPADLGDLEFPEGYRAVAVRVEVEYDPSVSDEYTVDSDNFLLIDTQGFLTPGLFAVFVHNKPDGDMLEMTDIQPGQKLMGG